MRDRDLYLAQSASLIFIAAPFGPARALKN